MSSKFKKSNYVGELFISKENYQRLLMWGMSKKEVQFICFGKGNFIENVVRQSNISPDPENYVCWHEKQRKLLIKEKKLPHQKIIAFGHSHPKKSHDQHPSLVDIKFIPKGNIELIIFPNQKKVRAWKIKKNINLTLEHEFKLVEI